MTELKVAYLTETARMPTRKNSTDAGLDLYADLLNYTSIARVSIHPNEFYVVHTGITVEIPDGYFGWITNKSKNNFLIGGGIVDQGYQGELLVKVINPLKVTVTIHHHDAVAQLLIIPVNYVDVYLVGLDEIHQKATDRGVSGGIAYQV
jgi:dUTP pyrophosphatase